MDYTKMTWKDYFKYDLSHEIKHFVFEIYNNKNSLGINTNQFKTEYSTSCLTDVISEKFKWYSCSTFTVELIDIAFLKAI